MIFFPPDVNSALSQDAEAAGAKYFFLLKNSRFSFPVNVDVIMINKMQIYLRAFKLAQRFVILYFFSQLILEVQLLLSVG